MNNRGAVVFLVGFLMFFALSGQARAKSLYYSCGESGYPLVRVLLEYDVIKSPELRWWLEGLLEGGSPFFTRHGHIRQSLNEEMGILPGLIPCIRLGDYWF